MNGLYYRLHLATLCFVRKQAHKSPAGIVKSLKSAPDSPDYSYLLTLLRNKNLKPWK